MDWILGHTAPSSVPGVSIGLDYFTDIDYADDVVLLVELLDLLEPALLNFSDEASKLGLQVNWKKTVVQSLNDAQGCPSSITVGSETVACVDQFTYLGSTIDSSGKSEPKIRRRRRITIAKSAMQQTYKSVWNAHIALATKLRLYNTCILPIVLYASECWAPTKADVARLELHGRTTSPT